MAFLPHWPKNSARYQHEQGLEIVAEVLNKLGNPHLSIPPVLHVAGTNGKGSTSALLFSTLVSAGYKVHLYTSPHIIHVNERIVVANSAISDSLLYNCLEDVRIASNGLRMCLFEALTVAAFVAFSQIRADFSILEVGMGGRLDATNIVDNVLVSIITSLSFDHVDFLGTSMDNIVYEKSGIMRKGVPCVVAKQTADIIKKIEDNAKDKKVALSRGGVEWDYSIKDSYMTFFSNGWEMSCLKPALAGDHQVYNAATVIAAISILNKRNDADIYQEDIEHGFANVNWPARIELINYCWEKNRLLKGSGWSVFVDGAHNPDAARVLSAWMLSGKKEPFYIITGFTQGKNGVDFFRWLRPAVEFACCVCVKSEPSACTAKEVGMFAASAGVKSFIAEDIEDAFRLVSKNSSRVGTVVICGSLYLVKDLHECLDGLIVS
ncbi:dihydrofolate synthase / folylpolyglutamate synthase [Candidatus Xenohaliotis californiensis]|uniref:Dihydrofolate synthase / folylpolyglutamate synthase n=1 Tax=Candidatus Xenohaliotis californiensis TaxID=84677 RepID=A0ABM9N834_9RICK|nr:dihydrofolate synthase / folylpolyglutamate synthase [Candidatus Xenohaliotis californiensis]